MCTINSDDWIDARNTNILYVIYDGVVAVSYIHETTKCFFNYLESLVKRNIVERMVANTQRMVQTCKTHTENKPNDKTEKLYCICYNYTVFVISQAFQFLFCVI